MADLRSLTVSESKTTHLRVGIKWDPLERDDIADAYGIESPKEARAELLAIIQQINTARLIGKFLKLTVIFSNRGQKFDRTIDQKIAKKKALEKYLSQEKLASYDLDLCCFCYDLHGKLVKFVSPVSSEAKDDLQKKPAFMHTGDATEGTVHESTSTFDEEILVDLTAIDPAIDTVFFVVVSVNHGFNHIKGGFWSIISTKDEEELLSAKMLAKDPHKVHVAAKLTRLGGSTWLLDEIVGFPPIDANGKISLQRRIDQAISTYYNM
ncbi:MAG: TerD family protein, partial [Alphaproteobacteria bacterium]